MPLDDIRRLAGVVTAPLVVAALDGEVLVANAAARRLCDGLVAGSSLAEVLGGDAGEMRRRLRTWSQQGDPVPARLTLHGSHGAVECRADVARVPLADAPALLLLLQEGGREDFARLNDQLERLRHEVRYRKQLEQERASALAAERETRRRLERLQALTAALASALSTQDTLDAILRFGPAAVGADGVVVRLAGRPAVERLSAGTPAPVAGLSAAGAPDDDRGPLAAGLDADGPAFFGGAAALRAAYPEATGWPDVECPYIAGVVPLRSGTDAVPLGVLGVVCAHGGELVPDGRVAAVIVASLCAQALERARLYDQERRFAETLQRALLPDRLPDVDGVELAVRYMPASETVAVGGDWYDVIALDGERVGLVVGDVAGHGPTAATSMAQVRSALRALATTALTPADALTALNAYLCAQLPEEMATVVFVVVDRDLTELRYANAGHLPPLLLSGGTEPSYLREGLGPPVGVEPATSYTNSSVRLDGPSSVIVYTDGLVERRGEAIDLGLRRLARAVSGQRSAGGTDAELLCGQVVGRLVGDEALTDDAVVLVANLLAGLATDPCHGRATAQVPALAGREPASTVAPAQD